MLFPASEGLAAFGKGSLYGERVRCVDWGDNVAPRAPEKGGRAMARRPIVVNGILSLTGLIAQVVGNVDAGRQEVLPR